MKAVPSGLSSRKVIDGSSASNCAQVAAASVERYIWTASSGELGIQATIFVVIATTILAFKLFTQVWVMTQGGPQGSTMTTMIMFYREGFRQLKVGYASAIAIVFFVIVLAISLVQRLFLKEERAVE